MQVHTYVVFIFVFGVCCELPQPKTGPGGSSFSLVDSWPDFDLAAFVDVNADRRTDALVWSATSKKLSALMSPNAKQSTSKPQVQDLLNLSFTSLRSVAVGDFNGDSRVDYLFVGRHDGLFNVSVSFGGIEDIESVSQFATEPVICDVNADMIADIYALDSNNSRVVLMGTTDGFHSIIYNNSKTNSWYSSNSGFASLGSNVNPSLVILNDAPEVEVYEDLSPPDTTTGQANGPRIIELDNALKEALNNGHIGKFVFGDFDMSGNIQLLIAGCPSKSCESSFIYLKSLVDNSAWVNVPVEWDPPDVDVKGTWSLAPSPDDDFSRSALIGPSLGDADLDGYPDLAVGLKFHTEDGNDAVFPAILRNLRGTAGTVKFKAYLLPGIEKPKSTCQLKQIAFFDYNEDGVLDLFLSHLCESTATTSLYVQKLQKEAYFLKVMLTTGRCGSPSDCPGGVLPYGLPGYGFRASYETQGADGSRIHSSAVFVTSACCGALQLPFTIFGFGDFANYVENVPVSIPAPTNETRTHQLTFIVPNAQVVVVPHPIGVPSDWQTKLFLEPLYDMKVIYVAITLLVTCLVLIVVVTVLQCLEVRSDQQEKLQESQRFHFDAM